MNTDKSAALEMIADATDTAAIGVSALEGDTQRQAKDYAELADVSRRVDPQAGLSFLTRLSNNADVADGVHRAGTAAFGAGIVETLAKGSPDIKDGFKQAYAVIGARFSGSAKANASNAKRTTTYRQLYADLLGDGLQYAASACQALSWAYDDNMGFPQLGIPQRHDDFSIVKEAPRYRVDNDVVAKVRDAARSAMLPGGFSRKLFYAALREHGWIKPAKVTVERTEAQIVSAALANLEARLTPRVEPAVMDAASLAEAVRAFIAANSADEAVALLASAKQAVADHHAGLAADAGLADDAALLTT